MEMLPRLTIETGPRPRHCVIWLHGLGADGHDFEPIVPELGLPDDLPVRFVFPHAPAMPVTINGGYVMPAWYDIRRHDLGIEHDQAGIARSARAIRALIEQQNMQGIDNRRIVLAGFSQGAAMALHVGLRMGDGLAGIIALSGYLLLPERLRAELAPEARHTPIFMAHGIHDPIVPLALAEHARAELRALGMHIDWHTYPMEHQVSAEEIHTLGRWLQEILSKPSTSSAST